MDTSFMWYSWYVLCSIPRRVVLCISSTYLRLSHVAQPPAAAKVEGEALKCTMWSLRSAIRADEW
ncbi:unnamed protein product [Ectocarpus sp. 6 AP-2014]